MLYPVYNGKDKTITGWIYSMLGYEDKQSRKQLVIHMSCTKLKAPRLKVVVSKVTNVDLLSGYIFTGVAGSVATVLHDAVMNPAEGKTVTSRRCRHRYSIKYEDYTVCCIGEPIHPPHAIFVGQYTKYVHPYITVYFCLNKFIKICVV